MLQLHELKKAYKTANFEQIALDGVSIAFRDNEFVAVLGPSGSGKTTMLNIVGGLDHYSSGDLIIDGISTTQYRDRDWDTYRNNRIGFVFQNYYLIPHQSVLANVELALTLSGVPKSEREERATKALEEVGLKDHIHKKPTQLSGGQMQRVAIARALINDPDIVLADEPTGALDSKTSVQIMALLTEIAKNRLVVMVTHNPDLADQYANRIIKLHDGKVVSDTNPFFPTQANLVEEKKSVRKTAMGFATALTLSFTNLLTKKGRTFMTAFAGSIGIIGIAAILALANGVNNYIKGVEEDTLSLYPLEISSSGVDLASMISVSVGGVGGGGDSGGSSDGGSGSSGEATEEEQETLITETKMVANTFSSIRQNDLAALKTYFDKDGGGIQQYVNTIEYTYNLTPQIFASDTSEKTWQVNPDFLTTSMGMGAATSAYSSFGVNTTMFSQMIEDTDLLKGQYDLVAGEWPDDKSELVLVLSGRGGISDYLLYLMGLRNPGELEDMLTAFQNDEEIVTPEDRMTFRTQEILDVTFKVVPATDFYTYDEAYNVWTDRTGDTSYMKQIVDDGLTLTISGIVKANPDAAATSMTAGLYYTADLSYYLMDVASESEAVKDQIADRNLNVITGKTFEEEKAESSADAFDMNSLFTVDEDAMGNAIKFDQSALNVDISSALNPAAFANNLPAMPQISIADMIAGIQVDVPEEDLRRIATTMLTSYLQYAISNGWITPEQIVDGLQTWLATPEAQALFASQLEGVDVQGLTEEVQTGITNYMQRTMSTYVQQVMSSMSSQIQGALTRTMSSMTSNFANAISFDQEAFANAFQFNMDEEELSQLVMTMMSGETNTYDGNLRKLGYADRAKPSGISIYPIDFASKQSVIEILDDYNLMMEEAADEDKIITYTDFVGVLMSSVTEIINYISWVLVAFVAISLIVSSIMIGVITYISVLERKKEIGILRAIGARKSDIGNVFNAETLLVGLTAGILGIGITLLLTIPANLIVANLTGIEGIASLPWQPAVALVVISCFLTFVSGLIPSSAASRRDPVEALRSE